MAPFLAHSATKLEGAKHHVLVTGSHGGAYVGSLALAAGVRAMLCNDAGEGLNRAGIRGLWVCERAGLAAAALDHMSCRIGNADDALDRGIVSHANAQAAALGVFEGMEARRAATLLQGATLPADAFEADGAEHRATTSLNGWRIVVVDSAALVRRGEDDGAVVVTGSHGGLVGDDPHSAGRAEAALFAFNDAGIGLHEAGVGRLPVLDGRGIAAVCVDCHSAEIGDGTSTLESGVVSRANRRAAAFGARQGQPLAALVQALTTRSPPEP